ncbi:Proline/betaine transporter [Moorella thermoacetica]|uniref:Proline/betaine transporter n=1 Tax=Neomoorella thermoacetica TaxID=1525 RepID=A0AAC9HFN1_NEOTH|nr:MFS transporter [Moorella thermoacetica]AOQ22909.1 Proline/betaine transporter [Moorella thermoacetica]TYL10562.1 Proline/betaine transporter [Moorella thermoacetica]
MANETSVNNRQVIVATIASVLGWSLDLFDLFLILYVAPTVGSLFFPSKIQTLSLASVFAAFAISVLVRPLGSAFFGNYADKWGRKRAMIITVTGVGVATSLLGTLPTFNRVGLLAPILFLLIRVLQGIFVGGVTASTHTIGTETVAPRWRGLMSGLISGGASIGSLVASIVLFIVTSIFPGEAFKVWGWRFMFFSGLLCVVFGIILYKTLEESPIWLQMKEREQLNKKPVETPLKTLLSKAYAPILLINIIIVAGAASQYYLTSGYLPSFLELVNQVSRSTVGKIMISGSIVAFISPVLVGHLSEMIGRKKTFLLTGIINLFIVPVIYLQLSQIHTYSIMVLFTIIISFLGNAAYAPVLIFLNERFPTEIRASGTALSWNIGFAIGGLMPTFVTALSPTLKYIPTRLIAFLIGVTILFLIGSLVSPETKGRF